MNRVEDREDQLGLRMQREVLSWVNELSSVVGGSMSIDVFVENVGFDTFITI